MNVKSPEQRIAPSSRVIGIATVGEASEHLGISRTRVYQLIEAQSLNFGIQTGNTIVIIDDLYWKAVEKRRPQDDGLEAEASQLVLEEG